MASRCFARRTLTEESDCAPVSRRRTALIPGEEAAEDEAAAEEAAAEEASGEELAERGARGGGAGEGAVLERG